ncbi:MAG: hypothetical protein LBP62_03660 [Clostridiales bacterium]|nr:hypothetical protein [Clostridiales bacterium]
MEKFTFSQIVAPPLCPLPRRGISALRALNGKIHFFPNRRPTPLIPSHGGE